MARYDKYYIQWNKDQLQPIPCWLTINNGMLYDLFGRIYEGYYRIKRADR